MTITTQGASPRLLQEGVNAVCGAMYKAYDPEWAAWLRNEKSDKAYEVDVYETPMRGAQKKNEGAQIFNDTTEQLYRAIYTNATYGIGGKITFEAMEDNLYIDKMKQLGRLIEGSLQEAEQIVAADLINNGYTTALAGDGVTVFNTAHILGKSAGTFANRFSVYTPLSEAALEDAVTAVSRYVDAAGKTIKCQTKGLVIPPDLWGTACRLLDSKLQAETGNNAVNAVNAKRKFSEGAKEGHYLTDTGAWFVTTDVENGGKFFRRMDHRFKGDNSDNQTWDYTHSGITRFSVGVTDPRHYYGSGPSA